MTSKTTSNHRCYVVWTSNNMTTSVRLRLVLLLRHRIKWSQKLHHHYLLYRLLKFSRECSPRFGGRSNPHLMTRHWIPKMEEPGPRVAGARKWSKKSLKHSQIIINRRQLRRPIPLPETVKDQRHHHQAGAAQLQRRLSARGTWTVSNCKSGESWISPDYSLSDFCYFPVSPFVN